MFSGVEAHFFAKLERTPIEPEPFPHFYLEEIFPHDFYRRMLANLPDDDALTPLGETGLVTPGAYPERSILRLGEGASEFWRELARRLLNRRLMELLATRFWPHIQARFAGELLDMQLADEAMLVRDRTRYALGPHTDAPHRLATMLCYLPPDAEKSHLGTTIYRPKDPEFRCPGGPHHRREDFDAVRTMAYRPNSAILFLRNDLSFHGVETIADAAVRRDILAYDIRIKKLTFKQPPQAMQAAAAG